MKELLQKLTNKTNENVFLFSILNYFDKGLIFLIPLGLIYLIEEKSLYNNFEYIYSWANIIVIFIDFGFRNYLMFGFKEAEDRSRFIYITKQYLRIMVLGYCFISIAVFIVFWANNIGNPAHIGFISIRTLFVLITSFFLVHTRLEDKPAKAFLYTAGTNAFTILVLLTGFFYPWFYQLPFLFISQAVVVLVVIFSGRVDAKVMSQLFTFLKKAIIFSWPIIGNVLIFTGMNNFAKIYAYSQLTDFDMFNISVAQRGSLFIQIAHASILGFYAKQLFTDEKRGVDFQIFGKYIIALLLSSIVAIALIISIDKFASGFDESILGWHVFMIIIYTILWCVSAFLEMYYHKNNRTFTTLTNSAISAAIFIGILILFKVTLNLMVIAMLAYMTTYIVLTIYNLNRIFKKQGKEEK